ncbi:MAG TPA: N-acetylmuramoyl-L-alanine amidase [Dissulfurispiraceae bacterium]
MIEVKGLRHWSTPEYTRVVIDLSGATEFTKGKLSNPERLFFDLKNTTIAKECQRSFAVNDKLIKSIRLGQFNANTARIVFDMEASDYDFKAFSLEDPPRFVIDILAKGPSSDKKTDTKAPEAQSPEPVKKPDTKKPEVRTEAGLMQRKIVIDAGHGGHDSGAVGPTGLYEKDVVLDIALKVRDIIQRDYPEWRVILTRDSDVFIPLPRRAQIANENDADFFLSIHANASPNRQARGIETYFLNWTDDEEALRVAARENAISVKEMKKMQSEMDVILASLDRDRKRDDSLKLAGYVQKSLISTIKPHYPKLHDLGVKSALFYVLVGAKMSSALAEVSFISNPEEERLLSTDDYRLELAQSLVAGINTYFSSIPQQRMVSHTPGEKISYNKDASGGRVYKARSAKYVRRIR